MPAGAGLKRLGSARRSTRRAGSPRCAARRSGTCCSPRRSPLPPARRIAPPSSRWAGTRCAASLGRKSCSRSIGRGVRGRSSVTSSRSSAAPRVVAALLPIMAVVLIAFLVVGLALPVLPLHVHQGLGLGTFVVGLVTGSQFAASLVSRVWSGHFADSRGAKRAVVVGLLMAAASGLLYLLSLRFAGAPVTSVTILLLGRALLGGAESFIITGALGWGLALVDPRHAGKVIAWVGTAMFAAMALGAPAGGVLYASHGFAAIALATALAPLAT